MTSARGLWVAETARRVVDSLDASALKTGDAKAIGRALERSVVEVLGPDSTDTLTSMAEYALGPLLAAHPDALEDIDVLRELVAHLIAQYANTYAFDDGDASSFARGAQVFDPGNNLREDTQVENEEDYAEPGEFRDDESNASKDFHVNELDEMQDVKRLASSTYTSTGTLYTPISRRLASTKWAMAMPTKLPPSWRIEHEEDSDEPYAKFAVKDGGGEDVAVLELKYNEKHETWSVVWSQTKVPGGWGAFLYDYAMRELSHRGEWLQSDQLVSNDAAYVWHKFHGRGNEFETKPRLGKQPKPLDEDVATADGRRPEEALKYRYRFKQTASASASTGTLYTPVSTTPGVEKQAMAMPARLPEGWRVEDKSWNPEDGVPIRDFNILDAMDRKVAEIRVKRVKGIKDTWRVAWSQSHRPGGWGAFLYETAMRALSADGEWLQSDTLVSPAASKVWQKYHARDDVEKDLRAQGGKVYRYNPKTNATSFPYNSTSGLGNRYRFPSNKPNASNESHPSNESSQEDEDMNEKRKLSLTDSVAKPKVASIDEPGMPSRVAHHIWSLRRAEDGEGLQVVRRHVETDRSVAQPATWMTSASSTNAASANVDPKPLVASLAREAGPKEWIAGGALAMGLGMASPAIAQPSSYDPHNSNVYSHGSKGPQLDPKSQSELASIPGQMRALTAKYVGDAKMKALFIECAQLAGEGDGGKMLAAKIAELAKANGPHSPAVQVAKDAAAYTKLEQRRLALDPFEKGASLHRTASTNATSTNTNSNANSNANSNSNVSDVWTPSGDAGSAGDHFDIRATASRVRRMAQFVKSAADLLRDLTPSVVVETNQEFAAPMLMSHHVERGPDGKDYAIHIPAGMKFRIEGQHDPDSDRAYTNGVQLGMVDPHDKKSALNWRIRLIPLDAKFQKEPLFVTPIEFQHYFERAQEQPFISRGLSYSSVPPSRLKHPVRDSGGSGGGGENEVGVTRVVHPGGELDERPLIKRHPSPERPQDPLYGEDEDESPVTKQVGPRDPEGLTSPQAWHSLR